jgi:cation diffusion facilitator CzcD-associated flavoprotein CzcO
VTNEHHRIVIVGTGFSGVGAAVRLLEAGHTDLVLLERAQDLGGTWRDNTYPGCRCDVPSHLYSFSFAPNPGWSETYSSQPEIWDYLRRVAADAGLLPRIRWGQDVVDAAWDDAAEQWVITTTSDRFTARVLILGTGFLVEPSVPELSGLSAFGGTVFHSARWDHGHDDALAGERVAVIGTGASAIQIVPNIQPVVGHLDVYQRTPPWVMPHTTRPLRDWEHRLYERVPLAQRLVRDGVYWSRELLVLGFVKYPGLLKQAERQARRHLHDQVPDPDLRARLTPHYDLGCKRVVPSNDYYPALTQPNVALVTDPISAVTHDGVVTADGTSRPADTIILATGFHVTDNPMGPRVHGRDGHRLDEAFGPALPSYLGTTVPYFPNMFIMTGPNTGLGHSSMVLMIESQLTYILDALRRAGDATFEVREDVAQAYTDEIQRALPGTVWASGCASWYLDGHGRNGTLWPGFTFTYRRRTRRFDVDDYRFSRHQATVAAMASD